MADEMEGIEQEDKIILFSLDNSDVCVWSAEDVLRLRTKYRIIGSLVGSLPRKPKQNVCLSLPLLLSQDETTLLLQKSIAKLVTSPQKPTLPSEEEVQIFQELRQQSIKEQIDLFDEENTAKESGKYIHSSKKKKRKGRKRHLDDNDDTSLPEKILKLDDGKTANSLSQVGKEEEKCNGNKDVEGTDNLNRLDSIPSISSKEEIVCPVAVQTKHNKTIDAQEKTAREKACMIHIPTKMPTCKTRLLENQEWHYPQTNHEELKYKIFQDLWEKGYYITSGSKFGGDFLAYPGDPFKFHSFYVVMVMSASKKISMLEFISIGRLAATVKKTAVIGSVNQYGNVVYSSIKWSGIS